ncbi:uncharacterized protein AB675_6993 [Cyphellophora attinorum]|uniref:PH domain-containing protein n=1 Tax=Cyphellophora attinorum TaxID=1664694 RepID=A0A0N1P2Z8_9EURO|nr:uncharacterized protein AB675_6993 [Phialophora attinorum]KPI43215.1 hypothetical protein AB675_6993 [Phialophora attinorum]
MADDISYTSHRLKHASPEHLHLTMRRFFIGPIPEGWLKDNRKSWYKRRLELSNYTSRTASFSAAQDQGQPHRRSMSIADPGGPSTAARVNFSFPQPEDVDDPEPAEQGASDEETEVEASDEDTDGERELRQVELVSTHDAQQALSPVSSGIVSPKAMPISRDKRLQNTKSASEHPIGSADKSVASKQESFHTAQQRIGSSSTAEGPVVDRQESGPSVVVDEPSRDDSDGTRFSSSIRESAYTDGASPETDNGSKTELLRRDKDAAAQRTGSPARPISPKSAMRPMQDHDPSPFIGNGDQPRMQLQRSSTGVRFKVSEGITNRQARVHRRVDSTRKRVTGHRRNTLREGTIVKMERMLVRIDITTQQPPDTLDENESLKVETRMLEKWREFMVVVRKSGVSDADDFRLQIYQTRVIPEIENESTRKKPSREVRLDPKTTRVNLYSSLDKSVVVWHPYRKGTRIVIMKASSTAHSVEWYTFLRDAMGWKRPATLQVNVPDLDVQLHLDKPFEELTKAIQGAEDENTALVNTLKAEQAVAGKIVEKCLAMLGHDPEWSDILDRWKKTAQIGLAWKRYDRLEWVHGVSEQKMYGSMAMQKTHELELRPKEHYATSARGKKGVVHEEPAPVEGFLIRLTSQKGVHQRMGKTFHKRLYYYTQNQFLFFNQPAKATPPHPPRLSTISGSNIPTASEIIEKTPETFDVQPYEVDEQGKIKWIYINLCRIRKVRKMKWGAQPGDENRNIGEDSDVDFHNDVDSSDDEDGTTSAIDDKRTLELVHDNGLTIRLQAHSKEARNEWITRLKSLVKYWKLRATSDMELYKAVRRANLSNLNIDEEMEAFVGQFGRKWEVSRSEASPELYHMCGIASCRTVLLSGILFRKARRRATFQRCSVLLSAGGKLLIHQATMRKRTGKEIRHLHQERQEVVDLSECYVYSGFLVEEDLLYSNQTFDANNVSSGGARTPRVYLDTVTGEASTSQDVDVMTCFVLWRNTRRGWFRTAAGLGGAGTSQEQGEKNGKRARIKRVAQLGVPGRGMVFKCRSRAERDHWVLSINAEIERAVEGRVRGLEGLSAEARVES